LIVLLFVAGNMEKVATSAAGPLLQILIDATKSNANTPMPTQLTMIFGPSISALGTSENTMCQFLSLSKVATSAAGPLLQILIDATKSNAGAICLLMYVLKF
jgi:hypothetical protein